MRDERNLTLTDDPQASYREFLDRLSLDVGVHEVGPEGEWIHHRDAGCAALQGDHGDISRLMLASDLTQRRWAEGCRVCDQRMLLSHVALATARTFDSLRRTSHAVELLRTHPVADARVADAVMDLLAPLSRLDDAAGSGRFGFLDPVAGLRSTAEVMRRFRRVARRHLMDTADFNVAPLTALVEETGRQWAELIGDGTMAAWVLAGTHQDPGPECWAAFRATDMGDPIDGRSWLAGTLVKVVHAENDTYLFRAPRSFLAAQFPGRPVPNAGVGEDLARGAVAMLGSASSAGMSFADCVDCLR